MTTAARVLPPACGNGHAYPEHARVRPNGWIDCRECSRLRSAGRRKSASQADRDREMSRRRQAARREAGEPRRRYAPRLVLLALPQGRGWRSRAACGPETAHLFVGPVDEPAGDEAARVAVARAVRADCPVVAECLADAVATGDAEAVRGGLEPSGRRAMRVRQPVTEEMRASA